MINKSIHKVIKIISLILAIIMLSPVTAFAAEGDTWRNNPGKPKNSAEAAAQTKAVYDNINGSKTVGGDDMPDIVKFEFNNSYGHCHILTFRQLCYLDIIKYDKTVATTASEKNGWYGVEPDFSKNHKKGAGGVIGAGLWTGGGNYCDGSDVVGDYTTYGITVKDGYIEKGRKNIDDIGIKRVTSSGEYGPANYRKKTEPMFDSVNKQFREYIYNLPDPCYNIVLEYGPATSSEVIFGHSMFINAIMSDSSGTKYVYYNESYSSYSNGYRPENLIKEKLDDFYDRYKFKPNDTGPTRLWHGGMYFEKQASGATPAVSKIIINGGEKDLPAYIINNDTCVRLRDVACILIGTGRQFNVTWDSVNRISIVTPMSEYIPDGDEMADNGDEIKPIWATTAKLNIDGKTVGFNVYVIEGSNYFKLDDLSKEIGLNVTYNDTKKAFVINAGELAKPLTSTVIIDGKETDFYAYEINGKSCFKIRDVAYALNGTKNQFSVAYGYPGIYIIAANQEYIPVKNDMTRKSEGNKTARAGTARLDIDGKEIGLNKYSVNGDDYFDFIDLGKEIGFRIEIEYNGEEKIYIIDTGEEESLPALTVSPTSSAVLVNGEEIKFDAYLINDNNYFKLRDLAYVLNNTEKQFEVDWDEEINAILLTSGEPYTPVGGELTPKNPENKTPVQTTSKIYLNGKEVQFTAYNIDDNNYFKLRDIGEAFSFGVDWDEETNTVIIDTEKEYQAE